MTPLLILVVWMVVLVFGAVLLRGAPYLPTMKKQAVRALDMLDLKPGQKLLELGSGDGSVLLEGAKRGIDCTGYELNPILVVVSKVRCRKYRGSVRIVWGDYWTKKWPDADAIFVFLLDKYMYKLDKKVIQYLEPKNSKSLKLLSNTFKIPEKKIANESHGLYLYLYK